MLLAANAGTGTQGRVSVKVHEGEAGREFGGITHEGGARQQSHSGFAHQRRAEFGAVAEGSSSLALVIPSHAQEQVEATLCGEHLDGGALLQDAGTLSGDAVQNAALVAQIQPDVWCSMIRVGHCGRMLDWCAHCREGLRGHGTHGAAQPVQTAGQAHVAETPTASTTPLAQSAGHHRGLRIVMAQTHVVRWILNAATTATTRRGTVVGVAVVVGHRAGVLVLGLVELSVVKQTVDLVREGQHRVPSQNGHQGFVLGRSVALAVWIARTVEDDNQLLRRPLEGPLLFAYTLTDSVQLFGTHMPTRLEGGVQQTVWSAYNLCLRSVGHPGGCRDEHMTVEYTQQQEDELFAARTDEQVIGAKGTTLCGMCVRHKVCNLLS
mmetsp:Transcript_8377/g.21148  ORF Transcript_8377/g.21148 Transcript_8377/m.21148 type:complete len:379 (+) Transcript_8377:164-1300(+)